MLNRNQVLLTMVVLQYSPITYLCTLHLEGLSRTSAALEATAREENF